MSSAAETKTLLTWEEGKYSGFGGYAGGIRLFGINCKTRRSEPDWSMRTELPGFTAKEWKSDDRSELYAAAEKFLAAWIARISKGATATDTTGEQE